MQSPEHSSSETPVPTDVAVVQANEPFKSPTDTISQLSQASDGAIRSFSSPLRDSDIGIPKSPEVRVISTTDETANDEGYDSDGLRAPWEDCEEVDFDGLDAVCMTLPSRAPSVPPQAASPENITEKSISIEEVNSLRVSQLRTELKKRGLSAAGLKEPLVARLKEAIQKGTPIIQNLDENKANTAGDAFTPGAHWELLECDGEYINESIPRGFRAPTVPSGENATVKKRNYKVKFDRMAFTGLTELPKRHRNGAIAKKRDGSIIFETKAHTNTEVNMTFVRKHKLNVDSSPVYWFKAFLPVTNTDVGAKTYSIQHSLMWTNLRATLEQAGISGKYADFKSFTLHELLQHLGIYLLQALSPSPQIDMKFYSQRDDPVNGNDLVHNSFGGKSATSQRRHRHFKSFFASNDPCHLVPSRDEAPNWKVHPFLKHILNVSKEAVFMGRDLSCDEQTVGFQGNHKDKQRITYKKEGDGFLADCICSDGYTFAFHFRHQDASKKIMDTFKCSPLHARVLGLISQLPHKYYTLGMDNLYNSAKLCRLCYFMDQKVMVHGVTRPSLRGIPQIVKQEEVKRKGELEKVRHTVRAAVLRGDDVLKDLVSVSVYDTKPVYFLSNACEEITWTKKEKKVYDPQEKKTFQLPFYRLNLIDFYNHNMGNVDLADQLRNQYRYDSQWHRNRKWWWAIWWWGFQTLLTNSYVLYHKYHKMIDSKAAVNHYDYIKEIALAWINPDIHWPKKISQKKRKAPKDDGKRNTRASRALDESSVSSSIASSKATPFNDKTLHPRGKLACRLQHAVQHFPECTTVSRPQCQLHRWARNREGKEVRGSIVTCSICRVNLCIPCFKTFHTEAYIVGKKDEIAAS